MLYMLYMLYYLYNIWSGCSTGKLESLSTGQNFRTGILNLSGIFKLKLDF